MEPSIANKGEAERCRDLAKTFLQKGDYDKAIKFFDKSLRLYPLPGVTALKEKAQRLKEGPTSSSTSSSSTSSAPSSSTSSSNSPSKPAETTRSYTEEQEKGAKEIIKLSKISHYKVLSVEKHDSEVVIKKAYRKLALKFHPDKNSAPSSEGAFKAINAAFDCLSDATKKKEYDMVGHDAFEGTGSSSSNRSYSYAGRSQYQEMSPEDIFNMFFTGVPPQMRRRQQYQQQQYYRKASRTSRFNKPDEEDDKNKVGFQFLIQLLPVLFMLLLSFTSLSGGSSLPNTSFTQTRRYQHEYNADIFVPTSKQFANFKVYMERPYGYYKFNQFEKKKFDEKILSDYRADLRSKCKDEKFWETKHRSMSSNIKAKKPTSIDGACETERRLFSRKPNTK